MIGRFRGKAGREDTPLGAISYMPGGGFDLVLSSLFINILALAMPLVLLQVYDRIIPNTAEGTLVLLVSGVATALFFEGCLRMGRSYVSGWMGSRFEHLAGCSAMERMLSANIVDFERVGAGVHLERMNALGTLKDFYAGQAILAVCDLPFAFVFLGAMAYLAGWLVFVPIALIIAFGITALWVGQGLKRSLEARMRADDRRYNFIIEVLGGIHTVKGLAMEEQMLRRYERLQETCADADYKVALSSANAQSTGAVFSQITMFAVVGFGSTLVIDGILTVGGLAACTMLSGRAMQPLQKAVGIWTRFQSIQLAREQLRQMFAMKPEAPRGMPQLPPVSGSLEMQGVSFFYGKNRDGDDYPTLFSNVSIRVEPGETVGIKGANASGKSTLLYMMNGSLIPTTGRVLIDDQDIRDFDPVSVRRQIAYLPQQGILFNGTILENLTMFRDEMNQDAMDIARILGLDGVVAHMPHGYDTPVGDGAGEAIPRGIKQRIAIGRALVDKPRILLFDEANTSMDGAGDAMLKTLLERLKGRVTLVLVTPRPSMLSLADRVYEIDNASLRIQGGDGPQAAPALQLQPQV